jgi:hypothetical protein
MGERNLQNTFSCLVSLLERCGKKLNRPIQCTSKGRDSRVLGLGFFDFLERSTDKERIVLVVVTWHLWVTRNGVRNGDPMRHPHCIAEQIKSYVEMIELHLFQPAPSTRRDTSSSMIR